MWRRRRRLCVVEDFKRSPSIQLINKGNSADATVPWTKKKWEVMTDEYHLCPRVIYTQTRWKVSFSSTSTSGTADEYLKNSQNVSEYSGELILLIFRVIFPRAGHPGPEFKWNFQISIPFQWFLYLGGSGSTSKSEIWPLGHPISRGN